MNHYKVTLVEQKYSNWKLEVFLYYLSAWVNINAKKLTLNFQSFSDFGSLHINWSYATFDSINPGKHRANVQEFDTIGHLDQPYPTRKRLRASNCQLSAPTSSSHGSNQDGSRGWGHSQQLRKRLWLSASSKARAIRGPVESGTFEVAQVDPHQHPWYWPRHVPRLELEKTDRPSTHEEKRQCKYLHNILFTLVISGSWKS